jgi:hypothetical protein
MQKIVFKYIYNYISIYIYMYIYMYIYQLDCWPSLSCQLWHGRHGAVALLLRIGKQFRSAFAVQHGEKRLARADGGPSKRFFLRLESWRLRSLKMGKPTGKAMECWTTREGWIFETRTCVAHVWKAEVIPKSGRFRVKSDQGPPGWHGPRHRRLHGGNISLLLPRWWSLKDMNVTWDHPSDLIYKYFKAATRWIMCSSPLYQSGWWLTSPSEKYESQMGLLFPIYGKIIKMIQTTNQMM